MAQKKRFFLTHHKKRNLRRNVDFKELWPKYDFFLVITKRRNVDFIRVKNKKSIYSKRSQKNVLVFEMLILSELWPKNDFFLGITKKRNLSRNIDFKRVKDKKIDLFKAISKERPCI